MGVLIWIPLNTNFLIANVELKEVFFSSYWASLYIETLVYRKCIFFKKKKQISFAPVFQRHRGEEGRGSLFKEQILHFLTIPVSL